MSATNTYLPDQIPVSVEQQRQSKHIHSTQVRLIIGHLMVKASQVGWSDITGPRRGSPEIIRARQVAMYLAHVAAGLSLTATGRLFDRDRRTVAHAAAIIEDRRDDDRDLDAALDAMEQSVRRALAQSELH